VISDSDLAGVFLPLLHLVGLKVWQLDRRNVCVIPHLYRTIPSTLNFPRDIELLNVDSSNCVIGGEVVT